jgi:hypothetical protein
MQPNGVQPDTSTSDITSNKHTLRRIKDTAKAKTKKALHIDSSDPEHEDQSSYEAVVEELNESPAFNSSKFLNRSRIGPSGIPDKAIAILQGTANAIVNPKAAIKSRATHKTAGKLAKSRPYLSRQADLDFLEAHDDLVRAKDTQDGDDDDETAAKKDGDIEDRTQHIQALEDKRHNMRVAWLTARHVQRVRVVDTIPPPPFPDESFFMEKDDCGFPAFNWGKWIAYVG